MYVIKHIQAIQEQLLSYRKQNKTIAFIPTMGALHEGHTSLIRMGRKLADITVCSIFVNPKQFNNVSDLQTYPRMLENDIRLLERIPCDILFAPDQDEVYPPGLNTQLSLKLGRLDKVMEGQFRPGHFKGMLQVVKRLLDIVQPEYLIMGQKDFQQFTLVRSMLLQLNLTARLVIGPTLREKDGLAMSSRNLRLSAEMRKVAPVIFKSLEYLKLHFEDKPIPELLEDVTQQLVHAGLRPEYVEIVDGMDLKSLKNPDRHECIVACIAAWADDVRLIDNLYLKGSPN